MALIETLAREFGAVRLEWGPHTRVFFTDRDQAFRFNERLIELKIVDIVMIHTRTVKDAGVLYYVRIHGAP